MAWCTGQSTAATRNVLGAGQTVGVVRPDDRRLSFDRAAEIYDEARPSYPAALFDSLFQLLPFEPEVVEVGPGTGQATRDLLARGASVDAIELGPALAGTLRSNLPTDRLRVSVDDFETVKLRPASADAVFSATAYHWIAPAAQTNRPARILRLAGVVAIVDLIQVSSPVDLGFFAAVQSIYERYGEGHRGAPAPSRDQADPAIRSTLQADDRFDQVEVHRYDWDQSYSASSYRKLMLSYSGTQMMNDDDRVGLLDDIESFIRHDFADRITRPLVATLTTAVLIER